MTVRPAPAPTPRAPLDVEWRLPRHSRSVGRSRNRLRKLSQSWELPEDAVETAVLLLSELMTNASCHARVPSDRLIGTRCVLRADALRVEVSDACSVLPTPRQAALDDESGRGLALVEALADTWGAHHRECGIGKTVWFEVRLPEGAAHAADR